MMEIVVEITVLFSCLRGLFVSVLLLVRWPCLLFSCPPLPCVGKKVGTYLLHSLAGSHVCKEGEDEYPADSIGCVGQKWVWGQRCI